MSPQGRPKGEYRNAQHGGCLMTNGTYLSSFAHFMTPFALSLSKGPSTSSGRTGLKLVPFA